MPIQDYNIYTGKGYAGDHADSNPTVESSGLVLDVATLDFGVGVKKGSVDGSVVVGHVGGLVQGITLRELNHEAANRPSDGTTTYVQNEQASILNEGAIYVVVTGRTAVAQALANINDTTGEFTGGTAGVGETITTNVRFLESGNVGDIVKVRIDVK